MNPAKRTRRASSFGSIRKLPSGRYQARYYGPDDVRYNAPLTFDTKGHAEAYLASVRTDITRGVWRSPTEVQAERTSKTLVLAEYAEAWLRDRDLKPRTRAHYAMLLDRHILPALGEHPLSSITSVMIRTWHARLETGPTMRAHAYSLLKTILGTAVTDELLAANPCRIRGASKVKQARTIKPATLDELTVITESMPDRLQAIVPLAAFCALRFGEVTELRRRDVDLTNGVLHIRRGVVRAAGQVVVDKPKSAAGSRDVWIPPHLMPMLRQHLHDHAQIGRDGLLFYGLAGQQLAHSSLLWHFNRAAAAASREDLTPHALRHTGAVLAAQTGATIAELMARLGHTTPTMAMRYQHASQERDLLIAQKLSALVSGSTPRDTAM